MMSYIKFKLSLSPSRIDCAISIPTVTTQFILSQFITLSFLTSIFLTLTIWIASYVLDFGPHLKQTGILTDQYWRTFFPLPEMPFTNLSDYSESTSIVTLLMFPFPPDWFFKYDSAL